MKHIKEFVLNENVDDVLTKEKLISLLNRRFGDLGTLEPKQYDSLYRYITKKIPDITPKKLIEIFKYVGFISTIDSIQPPDEKTFDIVREIEANYGL